MEVDVFGVFGDIAASVDVAAAEGTAVAAEVMAVAAQGTEIAAEGKGDAA